MIYLQKTAVRVGLVLRDSFLRDFDLIKLENIKQFSNLCSNFQFSLIWHRQYAIIFGLTQFGIDDPWPHLSCVEGLQKVMSLSHYLSRVWIGYTGDVITLLR